METGVVRRRKRSASAERIKNAYNGANNVEVEVIEAVGTAKTDDTPKEMRVCAYCRVSTEEESQQSSYELQVQHYTQYINDHENWTLQGIYADEGISGTSVMHRKQFLQMIEECKAGKRGCVECKKQLAKNIIDFLEPMREKRKYYEERPELVDELLIKGTEKARKTAKETMKKVKKAMRLDYFENM